MKQSFPALLAAACLAAAGCSSTPQAASPAAAPTPSPARKVTVEERLGLKAPPEIEEEQGPGPLNPQPYMDPETGKNVVKIPKLASSQFYEQDGRLYIAMVSSPGVPILRQDADGWIVEAPKERKKPDPKAPEPAPEAAPYIVEMPKSESAPVTPKTSKTTFRFEEMSAGLPRSGMWRENFDVGDVLGLGRPQIVAPPARLSGKNINLFRLEKDDAGAPRWRASTLEVENPENVDAAYGAATVADMDGDGKPDIIFGGHGSGPAIAYNLGGGKFRVETRGLPRQMSTRSIAVGDLNGDGRMDLIAISDDLEWASVGGKPTLDKDSTYLRGYDVRAFLNEGSSFREVHAGLEGACFGYTIALAAPREKEAGLPFYASACRYVGARSMLYEFDPKAETFRYVGDGVVEGFGQHTGAAAGTYQGHPAVYASWFKRTPYGGRPEIDGEGVTAYYRGADGKIAAKRVVKTLGFDSASYAVAVGDLDGDGLDDVVWADELSHRVRVFFQTKAGEFEELPTEREPVFVNHPTCLRITDVDGDGRKDVILMYQYLTGDENRAGGIRVFRGLAK